MWCLPSDLSALCIELSSGPHLLPPYYSDADIDKLCWVLRAAVRGLVSEVRLDEHSLAILLARHVLAKDALVVVRFSAMPDSVPELLARLKALSGKCVLLRLPEAQESGYGWLEAAVKKPLYRALSACLRAPEHPLAAMGIGSFPVMEAAGMTSDPMELVDLVERSIEHRIRYEEATYGEPEYRRSLLLTAGIRLAERLLMAPASAHQAALEVLLWGGKALEDRARWEEGVRALVGAGLAMRVGEDVRLGPLARCVEEREVLEALETRLPASAWSKEARHRRRAMHPLSMPEGLAQVSFGGSALEILPPFPQEEMGPWLKEVFGDEPLAGEALSVLHEAESVPLWTESLRPELTTQLVQLHRWLDEEAKASDIRRRQASRFLRALLQLVAARGADSIQRQEAAFSELEETLGELDLPWGDEMRRVALLRCARERIRKFQQDEDLSIAERMVRECVRAWKTGDRYALCQAAFGAIAVRRADYPRARDHYERAYSEWGEGIARQVNRELDLGSIAFRENRFDEAETRARKVLDLYKEREGVFERALASELLAAALLVGGELNEVVRIRRDEVIPLFDRLGTPRQSLIQRAHLALALLKRNSLGDREEAQDLLKLAYAEALRLGMPEAETIRNLQLSHNLSP